MSELAENTARSARDNRAGGWVIVGVCLAIVSLSVYYACKGVLSPRIGDTRVNGTPRPVEFLFGHDWIFTIQCGTALAMAALVAFCIVVWRRQPGHPNVLMAMASTAIVWLDPIMNWTTYAAYNPQLWHLPEDWPLVSMSPTVEPFIVVAYAFFFYGPYFPAAWVLRRMQAKRPMNHFVWRRPLVSLAGLIVLFGLTLDIFLEVSSVRTGTYIYTQAIPWGTVFAGTTFQFALIWQSALITIVMIPAGVLCYRDDTGCTVAEKLSQRLDLLRTRSVLATFLVMFGFMNAAYFTYGVAFTAIRASGIATSVACPWPYPEAKVYDPQGYYEKQGQPGAYAAGKWSTWMSGQPDGRPALNPLNQSANCVPKSKS